MRIRITMLPAAVFALIALAATAGSSGHVWVSAIDEGDVERFDLSELADGETRTFGEGESAVTATRQGDRIEIRLPDREGREPRRIECRVGKGTCYVMTVGDGGGRVLFLGDEGPHPVTVVGERALVWTSGEEPGSQVVIAGRSGAETGQVWTVAPGGSGGPAKIVELSGDADVSFYECPEGDTTMQLQKDDTGPYRCPKHGVELKKVDSPGIRHEVRVFVQDSEED